MEHDHWQALYADAQHLAMRVKDRRRFIQSRAVTEGLQRLRAACCASVGLAEELVGMQVFEKFMGRHRLQANLASVYPAAEVLKDCLPRRAVEAYTQEWGWGGVGRRHYG